MSRILKILGVLIMLGYLMVVLGFVRNEYKGVLCNVVDVIIHDSTERSFVSQQDIRGMIHLEHPELAGLPLETLNLAEIESNLRVFQAVRDVQVYKTVDGKLKVELDQRDPLLRISDVNYEQYYLDEGAYLIPARPGFAMDVIPFCGHIPARLGKLRNLLEESSEDDRHLVEQMLSLATYIRERPFWYAQIVQVYVNTAGEFELIPRVGAHIILFGEAEEMAEKFLKLEILYRKGFPKTGWNQYEKINLKYKDQIVCTKR